MSIRHGVATRMLGKWSSVERYRRDHPDHVIVCVVGLMEWESPDPAGQVARGILYVQFYHAATAEAAIAQSQAGLSEVPPQGWVLVGPFFGEIGPSENLDEIKAKVEDQEACFVATACCGSPSAPEVIALRAFRDRVLRMSGSGRVMVEVYYRLSPPLAGWIAARPRLRNGVRIAVVRPLARWCRRRISTL